MRNRRPELDFELGDLPCHTILLLQLEPNESGFSADKLTRECCANANVPVVNIIRDEGCHAGIFTLSGKDAKPALSRKLHRDDVGLVLHTSGTTKKPKIVPLSHYNLGHGIQFVSSTLRRDRSAVCLNVMPLFHIHGLIANVGVSAHSGSIITCSTFAGGPAFIDALAPGDEQYTPNW